MQVNRPQQWRWYSQRCFVVFIVLGIAWLPEPLVSYLIEGVEVDFLSPCVLRTACPREFMLQVSAKLGDPSQSANRFWPVPRLLSFFPPISNNMSWCCNSATPVQGTQASVCFRLKQVRRERDGEIGAKASVCRRYFGGENRSKPSSPPLNRSLQATYFHLETHTAHTTHTTHSSTHGHARILLGQLDNHGLGGDEQGRNAGSVDQGSADHLGGVNDTGLDEVDVLA